MLERPARRPPECSRLSGSDQTRIVGEQTEPRDCHYLATAAGGGSLPAAQGSRRPWQSSSCQRLRACQLRRIQAAPDLEQVEVLQMPELPIGAQGLG